MAEMKLNDDHCKGLTVYGAKCQRHVTETDYCWQHKAQGEYEREVDHAYAAHTSIY